MTTAEDLKSVAAELAALVARRDTLVRVMLTEGRSLRDVAGHAGLSHAGVQRIRDR